MRHKEELEDTVETLIELDEPEALLETLKRVAARHKGWRWAALALVLAEAEGELDRRLNAKPAGPGVRPERQEAPPASPPDAP